MQIGEEDLAAFELVALLGKRLLDLDDQLGTIEQLVRSGHELGAGRQIIVIADAGAMTCATFSENTMTFAHKFAHG